MNDFLWQTFHRLIEQSTWPHKRFLYPQLSLQHRLTGLIGPRGVGKTTLLLQFIKENLYAEGKAFYFSADNTYFNEESLLAFVDELYQQHHIQYFFIDEIHKYERWDQELKNIYDSFPDVTVFFSGSSSIDLIKGSYDLSRRAKLLYLPGLSFREYLNIKTDNEFMPVSWDDLLTQPQAVAAQFSSVPMIRQHFKTYLSSGYYPMVFQDENNIHEIVMNIIDKTIYEDIALFYSLKTSNLNLFKRIINFLASSPPGEVKTNNLSRHLGADNKTIDHYLEILHKTGLIKMLYPMAQGTQLLTRADKVYLDNTTLLTSVGTMLSSGYNLGTLRELAFMQFLAGAKIALFYPGKGDFQVEDILFEIGGKNKTKQQIKSYPGQKFVVKDDILIGMKEEIPLYLFGFLY